MKSFLLTVLLLVVVFSFTTEVQSQTLSYSRVLLVTSANDTVPVGKVWKIESVLSSTQLSVSTGTTSHQVNSISILVNGTSIYIKTAFGSSYNSSFSEDTDLPIWLPAGTILRTSTNAAYISVVEFNETP